jgi:acyl dehydratase
LWLDCGVLGRDGEGGISVSDARWWRPVAAGDAIHAVVTVAELRRTKKGRGFIRTHFDVLNQAGELVLTYETAGFVASLSED